MTKLTLHFSCLRDVLLFSKELKCGYLLNTSNCTITGCIPEQQLHYAEDHYKARSTETTERVYSYDPIL